MAKNKKHKLVRPEKTYSPIIAVLGGKHHTDYMPVDYGKPIEGNVSKTKTSNGYPRKRSIRGIFSKIEK